MSARNIGANQLIKNASAVDRLLLLGFHPLLDPLTALRIGMCMNSTPMLPL